MGTSIWDNLAIKYDNLWVQKHSLTPTRKKLNLILEKLEASKNDITLLDLGCGTGQFIEEVHKKYSFKLYGIDKSKNMLDIAKSKNTSAELFLVNLDDTPITNYIQPNSIDIIVCSHSFPYYSNKKLVLENLKTILKPDGKMIFVQASVNNLYDKLAMWVIEKTAEKADYLSIKEFKKLTSEHFEVEEEFLIKEKIYMPSICGFILKNKE